MLSWNIDLKGTIILIKGNLYIVDGVDSLGVQAGQGLN